MIQGNLYERNSSTSKKVELFIQNNEYKIIHLEDILFKGDISNLKVSSRLGNTSREISFEDTFIFKTTKNDLVDKYLVKKSGLLYKLESNLLLVLISIIIMIAFTFSFFKWGIPYSSKYLASLIPPSLNTKISENVLETLDKHLFDKTKISDIKKEEILNSFKNNILPHIQNNDYNIKLNFREWKVNKEDIPNAFALPDGNIIITDELIKRSENIEEIKSVIFHEIGHIVERHSLQKIIEGSFITIFLMYISGDATAISDVGVGIGSLLIDTHYSREHEYQADIYALSQMLKRGINPEHFSNILNKISNHDKDEESSILNYFSSHPTNEKRNQLVKKYKVCFQQKLKICN